MKPNEPGSISTDKEDSLGALRLQVCGLQTAVTDYNLELYFTVLRTVYCFGELKHLDPFLMSNDHQTRHIRLLKLAYNTDTMLQWCPLFKCLILS